MIDVRVQSGDFDPGRQLARLGELKKAALASFTARLEADEEVTGFWIDHYAPLAKAELTRMAEEASARWPLAGAILIHRHGRLQPCDRLLFVGVTASEVAAAEQACAFLVEALRTEAPFWRKELLAEGAGRWRQRGEGSGGGDVGVQPREV